MINKEGEVKVVRGSMLKPPHSHRLHDSATESERR